MQTLEYAFKKTATPASIADEKQLLDTIVKRDGVSGRVAKLLQPLLGQAV